MAKNKSKSAHPIRRIVSLSIILLILLGSVGFAKLVSGDENASFVPGLALDLAGGTQIILSAQPTDDQVVTDLAINQAIEIIRQRIDASGVVEADIAKQGTDKIVVGIPGDAPSKETVDLISQAAQLRFRPVIYQNYDDMLDVYNQKVTPAATPNSDPKSSESPIPGNEYTGKTKLDEIVKNKGKVDDKADEAANTPSGYDLVTNEVLKAYDSYDCGREENRKGGGGDKAEQVLVACGKEAPFIKYLLGPVAVEGTGVTSAQSGLERNQSGNSTGSWIVSLMLNDESQDKFIESTNVIKKLSEPRNTFAIVLDGLVISAPSVQPDVTFTRGAGVQITFGATDKAQQKAEATLLANQLSFGSMPMNFKIESNEQISATLGSEQLYMGLLAGLVGLILVLIYSLAQYKVLGFVIFGSLIISTILTLSTIIFLSWQMNYRLSLAGVIGIIVAIGVTADSFIVYFERIRDEIRDGRSLNMAVTRGWNRALRTILVADTVNFIAAVTLYVLAVGDVRGFAFTLGLTTILDVFIVYLFTYPVVLLLSKHRFFYDGHPLSGLSPDKLGAHNAHPWVSKKELAAQRAEAGDFDEIEISEEEISDEVEEKSTDEKAKKSDKVSESKEPKKVSKKPKLTIAQRRALEASKEGQNGSK